jgi:hypothetical protein
MGSVGIHPFMVETTEDRKVVGIRPVIAHVAQGPPIGYDTVGLFNCINKLYLPEFEDIKLDWEFPLSSNILFLSYSTCIFLKTVL